MKTKLGIKINLNVLISNTNKKNWLMIYSILNSKDTRTNINNELFERIRVTNKMFELDNCSFQKLQRMYEDLKLYEFGDVLMGCGFILKCDAVDTVDTVDTLGYVSFDQNIIDETLENSLKIMNGLGINKRLIDIVWFTSD